MSMPIFVAWHPANAVGYITPPLLPIHFFCERGEQMSYYII